MFIDPYHANFADFITFLDETVQIPTASLPGNSPWPEIAYRQARELVLHLPWGGASTYVMAVYHCATHLLFLITPDVEGSRYFTEMRSNSGFSLVMQSTGLIESASDQGTSGANVAPVWAARMTVGQLGFMKTMWGRAYLDYQQAYGPNIWGLS